MRKWLFFIVLVLCLAVSVSAGETVTLEDAGITLTIPDGYHAIYIGMPEDAPQLQSMGYTYEEAMNLLQELDVIFHAVNEVNHCMVDVSTDVTDVADFCYMSECLHALGIVHENEKIRQADGAAIEMKLHTHPQTVFYWKNYFYMLEEGPLYMEDYLTVHGGRVVKLSVYSSQEEVLQAEHEQIANMVNGIEFLLPPVQPEPEQRVDGHRYTQEESGLSFYIPANWSWDVSDEDEALEHVSMMTEDGTGVFIDYFVSDVYAESGGEKVLGYTREECDGRVLTEEMAEYWVQGMGTVLSVKQEYIDGRNGMFVELILEDFYNDVSYSYSSTVYYMLKNGYRHAFVFRDRQSSPYYDTFKNLLNSIMYSYAVSEDLEEPVKEAPIEDEVLPLVVPTEDESSEHSSRDLPRWAERLTRKVGIWIAAAIGAWMTKVKLKKKKKRAEDKPQTEKKAVRYVCPKCGADISPNSRFCSCCGNALNEGSE